MTSPARVTIEPPELDPKAAGLPLVWVLQLTFRTLVVWAVIAILMGGYGITYWMVLLGIIGLAALKGPQPYALTHAANRTARKARSRGYAEGENGSSDDALLAARSML